ncbi:MAG: hypothetical protein ACKVOK_04845 [Flavobacteriales bacterium]
MKNWLISTALIIGYSIAAIAQSGGPSCDAAEELPCDSPISGTTSGVAADGWTTGNNEGTGGQLWYRITAFATGSINISLCDPGSNYDTRIHAYSGSCGALTFIAQDDDACTSPGLASDLTINVTGGVTYYFRIGGFGSNSGNYVGYVTCNMAILGCTYAVATNYSPTATEDDGSCIFNGGGPASGCLDDTACNYCNLCNSDDGSCDYSCLGCTYPDASNYSAAATRDDGSCTFPGCTDTNALNYNPLADVDDGTCFVPAPCDADFNFDGVVSVTDLIHFIGAFGTVCP